MSGKPHDKLIAYLSDECLRAVPSLLSSCDRFPLSPTYGSFERNLWQYKIATDFPSAVWQQTVLTLALLYRTRFDGNSYFESPEILTLIRAGIGYWSRIQHDDGSFDEWYPNERSFVSTAFTAWAIARTVEMLGEELDIDEDVLNALRKTGNWLAARNDLLVLNHLAGGAAALAAIGAVTGESRYTHAAQAKAELLFLGLDDEGWFAEYGGADSGYLTVSLMFIAELRRFGVLGDAIERLGRVFAFLQTAILPGGTIFPELGSRNTGYLLPYGIAAFAGDFTEAGDVLSAIAGSLVSGRLPFLGSFDERYLRFFALPNALMTLAHLSEKPGVPDRTYPRKRSAPFSVNVLRSSGIIRVDTGRFSMLLQAKKGGIFSVVANEGTPVTADTGYFITLHDGTVITTQAFDPKAVFDVAEQKDRVVVTLEMDLAVVDFNLDYQKLSLPFRAYNRTLGRLATVNHSIDRLLKVRKIASAGRVNVILKRKITVSRDEIAVSDEIINQIGLRAVSFFCSTSGSAMHSPTSRVWGGGPIVLVNQIDQNEEAGLVGLFNAGRCERRYQVKIP